MAAVTEIYMIKRGDNSFAPAFDSDYEKIKRFKVGDPALFKIVKPRNYEFHKKFFALLQMTLENTPRLLHVISKVTGEVVEVPYTMEALLIEVKLKTGHYEIHVTTKGKPIYVPQSISFAAMDETSFEEFYKNAVQVVIQYFLIGMSDEEIDENVANFM